MSFRFAPVLALFIIVLGATAPASAADPREAAIAGLLQPWSAPDGPGAAVTVTLDGEIAATVAVGSANLEQVAPVTPTTAFHVASVSKQFTAFAILLLEQDGGLSIDDPLTKYVPEAAAYGPVTLRQLMNQTGGVRDDGVLLAMAGWRNEDMSTDEQALSVLLRQRRGNFAPGAAYQYTNGGYGLLAEVVRRVSGQSLADFCQERMFIPLGMTHTRFHDDASIVVPGRAESYRRSGERYVRDILTNAQAGATGLVTTAEDLSRWARNFETSVVGGPVLFRRMEEQGVLNDGTVNIYAQGQEHRPYKGLDTWSHGGRDAGFRAFLLRIPGERFTVSVLSNAADFDTAKVAFAVADLYLSDRPAWRPDPEPAPSTPTPEQLAAYAGAYEIFPGLFFKISTDGRRLLFAVGEDEPTELPVLSATRFELNARTDLSLEFPGTPNAAPGLKYRLGLHGALDAPRVDLAPFSPEAVHLEDFTGRFYSAELETEYALRIEDGRLILRHPRLPAIILRPYQPDLFAGSDTNFGRFAFERNVAGRVTGFQLSGPVVEGVTFIRTP
jgi:CubicO group peptidase (beta-lactamase class C family)